MSALSESNRFREKRERERRGRDTNNQGLENKKAKQDHLSIFKTDMPPYEQLNTQKLF